MTLFVKLGGAVVGVLTLGILTMTFKPGSTSIAALIGLSPMQSNLTQVVDPADDGPTETTGSLSEMALREAARRRLATALIPRQSAGESPASSRVVPIASAEAGGRSTIAPTSVVVAVDEAELHRLALRAEQSIDDGDIIGARLLLERAARAGDGKALFMLAQTYDPQSLSRLSVLGMVSDPELARNYYNKALSAGVGEARERLSALAP